MIMDKRKYFKILVVDDSPELLDITMRPLKKADFTVFSAVNGTECMKVLQKVKPDIILLDIILPDINGKDLCKKIKNDPEFSSVFIILISSINIHPDHVSEGLEEGANDYIIRPVNSRELLARVDAACRIITSENEMLRLSHRQEFILATVPDIIMEVDKNKVYSWANNAGLMFFGEKVIGKEASFYFEGEQDTCIKVDPLFKDNEKILYIESWQRRFDGQNRLLGWHCRTLKDKAGNITGSISSARDITEQKQAEEALKQTEVKLKEKTKDLLQELEKKRLSELLQHKSYKQLEKRKIATLNLLENIKVEIAQRKHAEAELLKLNTELERRVIERTLQLEAANSELESFAYSVSHDLRAPLRAIDGFSRFVLEDYGKKLDPEGKRLIGLIRNNTQKMDQLIIDILALSRVTRSEFKVSKIDMTKMAMSMFNEAASPEMRQKLKIFIDELPEVDADPTYIKQVWLNLISNAIKFSSRKKKPEIKIGGYTENGFHIYYVKDNGAGFNPEYSQKLFAVFQRLHNTDEFEGTGVGLAIVQRIIHRHGGKVWAEGIEGKSAIFYFSLPVKSC